MYAECMQTWRHEADVDGLQRTRRHEEAQLTGL